MSRHANGITIFFSPRLSTNTPMRERATQPLKPIGFTRRHPYGVALAANLALAVSRTCGELRGEGCPCHKIHCKAMPMLHCLAVPCCARRDEVLCCSTLIVVSTMVRAAAQFPCHCVVHGPLLVSHDYRRWVRASSYTSDSYGIAAEPALRP